ncbi:putative lipoprotein [Haemophilus sputorum HK 2154]|nr:putative lipoprotein [Haemophilus sputorum HK 2154]
MRLCDLVFTSGQIFSTACKFILDFWLFFWHNFARFSSI